MNITFSRNSEFALWKSERNVVIQPQTRNQADNAILDFTFACYIILLDFIESTHKLDF